MPKLVGKITNMRYRSFLKSPLLTVSFDTDVNDWQSKCCVKDNDTIYAVSKWTGPKRTRTYQFASVYDTLSACGGKTITIIPIVKDEGADSQNMDYLQWDTANELIECVCHSCLLHRCSKKLSRYSKTK